MKHICYVYIYDYKCLKNVELVIDCYFKYKFDKDKKRLTITKNKDFPGEFWGKNIYSVTGFVGDNGSGKSTMMSFLLSFLVEGSAEKAVNGIIVYEQDGKLSYYGKNVSVIYDNIELKPVETAMGLKDSIWKVPCFYYSGHFSPYINKDPRNDHLAGSHIASDNVLLVEDLQNYYNEDSLYMNLPLIRHLNSHVAQNHYRICMMLANSKLSEVIKSFAWPRYVIIGINESGIISIGNAMRNEELKREDFEKNNKKAKANNDRVDAYSDKKEYEKVLKYYKKASGIKKSKLGENHIASAISYNDLAEMYLAMGDYTNALEYYNKTMDFLGKDYSDIDSLYNNIALVYVALHDHERAWDYFMKAMAIRETKLGKDHVDTAWIYNNIAMEFEAKLDYNQALDYFSKAQQIIEAVLGRYHIEAAWIYNNIALAYEAIHNSQMALSYFEKALWIREIKTIMNLDTATIYENVAEIYHDKQDYTKALEYYEKAKKIKETILGKDLPETATTYNNIAKIYHDKQDYTKALEYYEKAMEIRESKLGEDHLDTATTYDNIARLYQDMFDSENALKYFEKARVIRESKLGETRLGTTTTNNTITKENHTIPPFKSVFDLSSKDHFMSLLVYHNLLNIINDIWGWKNGFDIINEWQKELNNETPIMDQLFKFINSDYVEKEKETLRSLYDMLIEIQELTTYKSDSLETGFLYIDCEKSRDSLINLGEKVLNSNKFYLTSKFFDFSYAQTLDSDTILSSGEQELLNLFSRLYDAIVLRPDKFSNLRSPSLLMFDEAEIGFHPDWQRRYLKLVIDFIDALNSIYPKLSDYQIIISTHSPILLSDIPKCCTNYLKRKNGQTEKVNSDEIGETFAENVFQLYRKSFFMKDGLVGEFARYKIRELESKIDKGETEGVLNEIIMIGDDGIREYLLEKFHQMHPELNSVNKRLIEYYKEKISQLQGGKEH